MSCSFWLRRKRKAVEKAKQERLNAEKVNKTADKKTDDEKPVTKAVQKNDNGANKKS